MNPLDIIEIPGYPGWYARRAAVWAWQAAGSPPLVSAGRLYADQKYLYDGYRARKPGFNPADNPDDESLPLAHCRFVAFDLKYAERDRGAMIAAGFRFPYPYERWHGELPNVRSYAIVREIPSSATSDASPFPIITTPSIQEDDMPTIITSAGGQSLAIEGAIVPLVSPEEVRSIKITPGLLECAQSVHARINALVGAEKSADADLPVLVYVPDGNGTVYTLSGGQLRPLVDPASLGELAKAGAVGINLSQAEVSNLLKVS